MSLAIITSVSQNISDIAALTIPNKAEYCLRHGYSLVVDNQPYDQAVARTDRLCDFLDRFDVVWTLDADAVITDMTTPVHALPCLGPNVTVCEEGIVAWNRLNCGSMVWKNTFLSRWLACTLAALRGEWQSLPCQWQTWLGQRVEQLGDVLAVAPLRSFNSCAWNRPGGADGDPGSHWQPGDLVFHPCGVFPHSERLAAISQALKQVAR